MPSSNPPPRLAEVWFLTSELEGERASSFRQERWCRIFLEAGAALRIFNLRGAFDHSDSRVANVEEMLAFPNGIHDDFVDMLSLFGMGLQSQFGKRLPPPKKEPPKFGTLGWVRLNDKWADEREAARQVGGF